jgi:F-type H+-transporting ATPase subunit c
MIHLLKIIGIGFATIGLATAKIIGIGYATMVLIGAGIGIGVVFGALIIGV